MAKITRILFGLIFAFSLTYANEQRILEFDQKFANSDKNGKIALHQDMRAVYVKSIIDNDEKMKAEALKRLLISSKSLGENPSQYENELALLTTSGKKSANLAPPDKGKKSSKLPPLNIKSISKADGYLQVNFSGAVSKDIIKFRALKTNTKFRNVYDFSGVWISKSQSFKDMISDEVKISQYDPNTVRIVLTNKTKQEIEVGIIENSVRFYLKDSPNTNDTKQDLSQNRPQPKAKVAKTNKQGKIIVLDAGHGGDDPGAMNGNLKEKNIVLNIALKTGEELKKRGYRVFYTRNKDKFINLRNRTKMANDKFADLFISIHANAAPNKQKAASMQGIETFFLSPARSERSKNVAALENKSDIEEMNFFSKETFLNFLNREKIIASNKLAIDIQREVLARAKKLHSGVIDGGVREAPFWVLVGALMPAVLLEVGYISHPSEGKMIAKSSYQDAIARGVANGVDIYFANQQ